LAIRFGPRFRQRIEIWCAVHFSALIEGPVCATGDPPGGSGIPIAAHAAIGVAGHVHRHSDVVRSTGHRQDTVRPAIHGLHHLPSAAGADP